MIQYNSSNLIVGYIKEMLKSFNLLKFKPTEKVNYQINESLLNVTKNFKINSLIYDSYTHTYLGDYLRYLRDYRDLDLMSMYNCFTYDMPKNLNVTINLSENDTRTFNSNQDSEYKIFMLPVKPGATYTLAMESSLPVELVVVAYDEDHCIKVYQDTYKYISNMQFKSPITYTVTDINDINKPILKLLIKMPYACNTSVVVLEGDYSMCTKKVFTEVRGEVIYTKPIVIGDELPNDSKDYLNLQLLNVNDGVSYPFADRLLEYIVGNVITNIDDIPNNIIRTQKALVNKEIIEDYSTINYGKWSKNMNQYILKYLMNRKAVNPSLNNLFDNLGYVDKDIEDGLVLGIKDGE